MRQYFDDGDYLDFDSLGNIIGGRDSAGGSITPPSSNIANQVFGLLAQGVTRVLDAKYPTPAQQVAQAQVAPTAALQSLARLLPMVLIIGGGVYLFTKIAAK